MGVLEQRILHTEDKVRLKILYGDSGGQPRELTAALGEPGLSLRQERTILPTLVLSLPKAPESYSVCESSYKLCKLLVVSLKDDEGGHRLKTSYHINLELRVG
jgi:hypothetical protein